MMGEQVGLKDQDIVIDGFGIGGYRSFGSLQLIGPLAKVNLFVGPNNAGKSNILRFAAEWLARILPNNLWPELPPIDRFKGSGEARLSSAVALNLEGHRWWSLKEFIRQFSRQHGSPLIALLEAATHSGTLWFRFPPLNQPTIQVDIDESQLPNDNLQAQEPDWVELSSILAGSAGSLAESRASCLGVLAWQALQPGPKVVTIPAVRKPTAEGGKGAQPDGAGIVGHLAVLQNPSLEEREKRKTFDRITQFVRDVLGDPEVEIEIPHDRTTILVHQGGKVLPLESLGTGVHEVIILAATATVLSGHLICIEEPEVHLHPILQRKLITYLAEQTRNQYLIATHSAHFLDVPGTSVFHVRLEDGETRVRLARTAAEKSAICQELGYRASDLLQANCVIWVEGPSDRTYLRHWLQELAPDLVEGVHFSIMFYGGRLLSHLAADDPEVTEFIALRRLNRNMAIVIDSDRAEESAPLNATKERILREYAAFPERGFPWVTAGRTIENYIPGEVLERAIRAVHPAANATRTAGRFDHVVQFRDEGQRTWKTADKVKVARRVAEEAAILDVLDLGERLVELASFIRAANGERP